MRKANTKQNTTGGVKIPNIGLHPNLYLHPLGDFSVKLKGIPKRFQRYAINDTITKKYG